MSKSKIVNKPKANKEIVGKSFRIVVFSLIVTGFVIINAYNSNQIKSLKNNNAKLKNEMSLEKQVKKALEDKNVELNNKSLEYKTELRKLKEDTDEKEKEIDSLQKKLDVLTKEKGSQQTVSSRSGQHVGNWIAMKASAYSSPNEDPHVSNQWGGKTKIGVMPRHGVTIAIPRNHPFLKLGDRVEIQFPKEYSHLNSTYICQDTFGAGTSGNRIDIFMNTYSQSINFGRRDVQLRIVK